MSRIVLFMITALSLSFVATDAFACGNKMHRFLDKPTVNRTERLWNLVATDKYRKALEEADDADDISVAKLSKKLVMNGKLTGSDGRTLHAIATAIIRSRGRWDSTGRPTTPKTKRALLRDATRWLKLLARNGPEATAHYAEALALQKDGEPEALRIFTDLYAANKLHDRKSLAVYSRLLKADGQTEKARRVKSRIVSLTKSPRAKTRSGKKADPTVLTLE